WEAEFWGAVWCGPEAGCPRSKSLKLEGDDFAFQLFVEPCPGCDTLPVLQLIVERRDQGPDPLLTPVGVS
ncbi:MAG TPA: hypothetical protein VN203_19005, partial [Candidatus Acidoferrum sp.]|nr:hypothetical protein [Candidatus Acidoferrum sp.]